MQTSTDTNADLSPEQHIWQVVEAFNQAFASNDPERYFAFIDEEITVLTPANPYRIEGIADDREEFEWGLKRGSGKVGYFQELQPQVHIYGDVAVVTYYSRGNYGAEPAGKTLYLKETDVLVRREHGWKVVHIHVSTTS